MFCTAAIAETVIGNTLERKIRKIGALSSTPNQRIATGIHAIGEIGRRTWIIGLKAKNRRLNQPRSRPTGTPTITAPANPTVTRKSDATMYFSSSPLRASSTMPRSTSTGLGKMSLPERRTLISHASRNSAATRSGRPTLSNAGWAGRFAGIGRAPAGGVCSRARSAAPSAATLISLPYGPRLQPPGEQDERAERRAGAQRDRHLLP